MHRRRFYPGRSYDPAKPCSWHCSGNSSALEGMMYEVEAAARARGVAVPDDRRCMARLDRAPVLALGNMRDIVEGRLSESEMEIGAVIRLAKTLGVPCLTFLYASLLPQESKARGIIHFPDAKSSPFNTPDAVLLP